MNVYLYILKIMCTLKTGTGKSYLMSGTFDDPGIIPCVSSRLFYSSAWTIFFKWCVLRIHMLNKYCFCAYVAGYLEMATKASYDRFLVSDLKK